MAILPETREVVFRDGSRLTVSEEDLDVGFALTKLEKELLDGTPYKTIREALLAAALEHKDDDRKFNEIYFHLSTYPKLKAATVAGDIPIEEDARRMPAVELNKWYVPVVELNPHWFRETASEEPTPDEQKKRKPRTRKSGRSSRGS